MTETRAEIDPLACRLAREGVKLELRKHYDTSEQLPAVLFDLLEELDRVTKPVTADRVDRPDLQPNDNDEA